MAYRQLVERGICRFLLEHQIIAPHLLQDPEAPLHPRVVHSHARLLLGWVDTGRAYCNCHTLAGHAKTQAANDFMQWRSLAGLALVAPTAAAAHTRRQDMEVGHDPSTATPPTRRHAGD